MEFFDIKFDEEFIGRVARTDGPPTTTAWKPGEDDIECSLRPTNPSTAVKFKADKAPSAASFSTRQLKIK